nr:sushi domain-containing protein 1 isoform X2 [Salvelinus alpinus]
MYWRTALVILAFLTHTITEMRVTGQTLDVCATCHPNATCEEKVDGTGKACNCMYGFVGNGRTYCQDKNECQIGANKICGQHTACHNTYGSYYCTCLAGYSPSNNMAIFIPNDGTRCQATCGPAPALANTEVVLQNTSVVFHRCLEGFHSWRGRNTSVCDITGKWQAATMRCREIKPAISDLVVFNEKCLRWKADKYEEDTENYRVAFVGFRAYQRSFHDKRKKLLSSTSDHPEICLNLLPVTNYTISITALSARFTSTLTTNTSLQVPQAPEILYREIEAPLPTLWLRRSADTLDPISFYQVFVLPLEGTLVFDCSSPKTPDFSSQRKPHGQYITAQLHLRDIGKEINLTLGDGHYYGGFYNAPLQKGRDYYIILRAVSQWGGAFKHSCVIWAKVRDISYIMKVSSLFAGGSIGVFALAIFLGHCYTW